MAGAPIEDQVRKERIKLSAAFMNNIATAFVVVGFVSPLLTVQIATAGRFLVSLGCTIVGVVIHGAARHYLEGLEP